MLIDKRLLAKRLPEGSYYYNVELGYYMKQTSALPNPKSKPVKVHFMGCSLRFLYRDKYDKLSFVYVPVPAAYISIA